MPAIQIKESSDVLTANGTTAGVITIGSTANYYVGAFAWVATGNNSSMAKVIITNILSATTLQVRQIPDSGSNASTLSYGVGSDMTPYTTVANSRIELFPQPAVVDPTFTKPGKLY